MSADLGQAVRSIAQGFCERPKFLDMGLGWSVFHPVDDGTGYDCCVSDPPKARHMFRARYPEPDR